MVEEYDSIVRNSVWDVVPRPEDKSVVSSHWLYKVKQVTDVSVEKHKARFVACGFSEVEGIDYDETLAFVCKVLIYQIYFSTICTDGLEYPSDGCEDFLPQWHDLGRGDEKLIKSYKEDLAREFEMKHMGLMHYFLGMEVWQGDGEFFVSQGKYANEILMRFRMESSKHMETPLADMCYVVNQLSQAMVRHTKPYWKATKHVLRYLRGTTQFVLWYIRIEGVKLQGFTDADWVGSPSHRKSTSGRIFSIGSVAISWYSTKWRSVALSSAEAEYMVASQVACEAI
eukprot:PITA_26541